MPTDSASPLVPSAPPTRPARRPTPVERIPLEPAADDSCSDSGTGCECTPPVPGGPTPAAAPVGEAEGAIGQAMPPNLAQGGGGRAGSPYRINPANGRMRTAIAPPTAGKFETSPTVLLQHGHFGRHGIRLRLDGTFRRKVTEIDSTTADVTTDTGVVLRVSE